MTSKNLSYHIFKTKISTKLDRETNNNYIKESFKQSSTNQNYNSKKNKRDSYSGKPHQQIHKFQNVIFNKYLNVLKTIPSNNSRENYLEKKFLRIVRNSEINIFLHIQNINFNLVLNIIKNHLNKNIKSIFEVFLKYSRFNCFAITKYYQIVSNFYFHYFNLYSQNSILWKIKHEKKFNTKNNNIQYNILILRNIWNKTIQSKIEIESNFIKFDNKVWLQIIFSFKQNETIGKKLQKWLEQKLFSTHNILRIYMNYNWNKFFFHFKFSTFPIIFYKIKKNSKLFFPPKYNFWRKTKNQDHIMLKKFTRILFLHMVAKKYATLKKDGKTIKATPNKVLVIFDSLFIMKYFSNIIQKIIKYHSKYILCYNIRFLVFIFRKTCALTLASKYRLKTSTAGFKKFEDLI